MLYSYQCPKCHKQVEAFRACKNRNRGPRCPHCKSYMKKQLTVPVPVLWPPAGSGANKKHGSYLYLEHVSSEGKHFGTKRELKDYCKANGLRAQAAE